VCVTHRDESRADLRDGLDYLEQRFGVRRAICIGLCAGAYQGLHLAIEDPRIVGLALLNPLRFQGPRVSFPGFREIDSAPFTARARAAVDPAKWVAVLSGRRDLGKVSRRLALELRSDARARIRRLRARVRGENPPPVSWMAGVFQQLTGRGCDVLLVLNAGDAVVRVVDAELGAARTALTATSRFGIELVADTDHIFSPLWSQERLTQILDGALDRWLDGR
jgi:pimeloyl-ACP methyl ester carboxylesterase